MSGRDSTLLPAFIVLVGLTGWLIWGIATNGGDSGSLDDGGGERAIGAVGESRDRGGDPSELDWKDSGALAEGRSDAGVPAHPGSARPDPESASGEPQPTGSAALDEGSGSLVVVVEDRSGSPLAGVRVALRSGQEAREVVTGRPGEARFADLPVGSYDYVVQPPDGPELASAAAIAIGRGEEQTLVLRLEGYALSISGRVLDPSGQPVPGIELVALKLFPKGPAERSLLAPRQLTARSGEDGSYAIRGLDEGDYQVQTEATDRYASATVSVRAGSESADIVLADRRRLAVHGSVTSSSGDPLSGVRVVLLGDPPPETATDEEGGYNLYLDLDQGMEQTQRLRFQLTGYRDAEREFAARQLETGAALRIDVELQPLGENIEVSGTLRTEQGRPVAAETVHLRSPTLLTRYRGVSDADGQFVINDVQVGSDYRIFVWPRGTYRDYVRTDVALTQDGDSLDIVLESLGTGRLEGRMVDADGRPVPRFRLWLWTRDAQRKSREVSGDDDGYFVLDDVPAGRLAFKTRARPELQVGWIELDPGEHQEVLLVLDWGEHWIGGRVVDEDREPVSGAELQLRWSSRSGGLDSQSTRQTVSDPDGLFRFEQLGPGPHRLEIRAAGYAEVQQLHDVDREVELRLRPSSP